MSYLLPPVIYLESKDFTASGNLKHFKDKTCVIMVQATDCGHCTSAKPHFQNFAKENAQDKSLKCLTVEVTMSKKSPEDDKWIELITKIKPSFQGFPDYFLFKNGKFIEKELEGRNEEALKKFVE
jgi:thiol-disulfide isomerase/thioredoxin